MARKKKTLEEELQIEMDRLRRLQEKVKKATKPTPRKTKKA